MAAAVPYALSVHGFIDKVGADAGFAAIIGVALVVIMLFVHAREAASLRERAEDAEDRVDYLERTVEHLSRVASQALQLAQAGQSRPGVTPAPAAAPTRLPASAQRPVPAPAVAAAYAGAAATRRTAGPPPQLPAAPFGTAGPALSSATRLIPEPETVSTNGHAAGAAAASSGEPATVPSREPAAASSGDPAAAPPRDPAATTPPPAPAPSTAAAGASAPPVGIPSLPRSAAGETATGGDAGSRSPRRNYGRASESRSPRRILPFVVVVVLVAVIAVAAVIVFGHHHHPKGTGTTAANRTHSSTTATGSKGKKGKRSVTVNPRTVTVAVLNGTTTNNLAADVSQKLARLGFKQGPTKNFSNQTQTTTTIGYVPGRRAQALAVAKALKVKYAHVLKVTAATQGLVCPAGAACPDQVFVVLGTDLNSAA